MANEPDDDLLAAARAGDNDALERLLERHQAQVYRFGLKMCRDPEAAKDVLQETLLAMARNVRDFRGASSVSTWLYSIARSFCIKKRRKGKFAPERERSLESDVAMETAALADPARAPDDALEARQVEHALEQAIRGLEPMYREVLLLRDVEGLTAAEVAEVLGISTQAVKSRLHRARLSVREHVAPLLGVPEGTASAPVTCPDVLSLFSQHLEDEISADVCADMQRHLAGCSRCERACDSMRRTLALCQTSNPSDVVPASVQQAVKTAIRSFLAEKR